MKKFFLFGSLMLLPQTGNAITTTIPAGTVSSGGDIMSIVTQNVYGEADNYTVFGTQQVMSGGKTNGSIIYSYGQQNVLSGGVSNNTTVQYYGMQNINGSSYNSSVDTRGTINVNRGGYAEGTIVNGGTYSVLSGASSSQTIVNSGREYVTGTEENATINGGTQEIKSGGIAENTTINNGGTQQVDEGGTAKETIISSGGSAVVYGTSTGTLVDSGAKFKIYGSGVAENTIISGGTMEVSGSGTSLSSQMISGIQRVYGLASGSSISGGTQTVYSGGKAENTKISGDGIQNVSYSGLAVSTNLYGGTQNINNGATAQNTVLSGGEMNVLSGGTAMGTELNTGTEIVSGTDSGSIINGGLQQIASGGKAVSTTINGGTQEIQEGGSSEGTVINTNGLQQVASGGVSVNTTISGGEMNVLSGGTATGTELNSGTEIVSGTDSGSTINGGLQQIADGGKAVSTTINGGTQEIQEGGSSEGTVINTNGLQQVASGGVSDNTTINGGEMNVLSGGTATGTELNSGTEIVSGTDSGSTINGGTQSIYGGGISENPNVKGGNLRIYQGGTSINTTVTQGSAELYTGGTLSGQTQISQGTLNIYGDNTIPTLILNDSMVNIPQSGGYSTLQIGELNGSGIFNLSSNLADDEFDSLEITNGTGNFGIIFHDYSSEGTLPTKIKIINKAGSANDNFYLIGDAVDVGAFQYKLLQEGNNWLLSRTQQLTDSSLIAKNTYTSLSSLFYTHLTPIYNRLHIAHPQNKHDNGLWIKAINRRIKFDYKDMTNSHMDVYGTAIGFDREAAISDGYIITLGAYGSYSYSRQKYNQRGHADGDTESLGLYASLTTPSLLSFDVVGSYYWHDQKIRSYTPSGSPVDGKFTNNGWQVSSYVSRRFDFGEQWYVSPIAGLRYMRIEGVNYHTNFNTPVSANASDFLSGSIGLSAGKRITLQSASILDAYGRFNLIHDWDGKSNVTVADYTFTEDVSTMRYELGAGLNFYNSEDSGAGYLDVSTQLGSKVRYPWEINVGWQYKF